MFCFGKAILNLGGETQEIILISLVIVDGGLFWGSFLLVSTNKTLYLSNSLLKECCASLPLRDCLPLLAPKGSLLPLKSLEQPL